MGAKQKEREKKGKLHDCFFNEHRESDTAMSIFQETKLSIIVPRCPINGLSLDSVKFRHILTFYKRNKPFSLCLRFSSPGMSVHRLLGTSKQPVASGSESGSDETCHESQCKHATFELDPEKGYNAALLPGKMQLTYTYNLIPGRYIAKVELMLEVYSVLFKCRKDTQMLCCLSTNMRLQQSIQ